MKKLLGIFSFSFALCLTLGFMAAPALGHEFILKPISAAERAKAEPSAQFHAGAAEGGLLVEVHAAHLFMMISEEMEPLRDVELFEMADGKRIPLKLEEDPANKRLVAHVGDVGSTGLILGHRKGQLWSDTTGGIQEGGRKSLEEKGYKVLSVGLYEKFAKLLLNAAPKDKYLYNKVAGDPLEIVLLSNPASLRPGDELECRILWLGQPLAAEVRASFNGYIGQEDVYAVKTVSGVDGIARFKLERPGLWFIGAEKTSLAGKTLPAGHAPGGDGLAIENGAAVDEWVVRATYTFEIK